MSLLPAGTSTAGAKVPADVLDYSFDWATHLQAGETITVSSWTVPTGLATGAATISGAVTTQWISGGSIYRTYTVVNRITTSQGRVLERSFVLPVVPRL